MNNGGINFIKREIERSGFPLEIEISTILEKNGWNVHPSSPFLDEDENKWREIDLKSYKSSESTLENKSLKPYRLNLTLIIECKKSEEFAWVFFPRPRIEYEFRSIAHPISSDFLTVVKRQSLLRHEFIRSGRFPSPSELHLLDIDESLVRDEAIIDQQTAKEIKFLSELKIIRSDNFRNLIRKTKAIAHKEIKLKKLKKNNVGRTKNRPSEIFEASNSLIKATKYELKIASTWIYASAYLMKRKIDVVHKARSLQGKGNFEIDIILPILVFDGPVYSWFNNDVKSENEILFEGRCHTKYYFENMLIDVIQKKYFQKFLKNIMDDYSRLLEHIHENRARLDAETKK